jgi:hypothetical protein
VRTALDNATSAIEERCAELLRAANREVMSMGASQRMSLSSTELKRTFREAMAEAQTGPSDDLEDHEATLALRRRKVEETLAAVSRVETMFHTLAGQQKTVDQARAAAKGSLATAKASLRTAADTIDAAGISQVLIIKQVLLSARDQVHAAEEALKSDDVDAFEHEVHKAAYAVTELTGIVEQEKKRKEDDDLRSEGRALLEEAAGKVEDIKREADEAGVRTTEPFVTAIQAVEGEISSVSLLMSGDPRAYLAACRHVASTLDNARAVLRSERLKKEKNDQQREVELARLQPSLLSLQDIQSSISQNFELASEDVLCSTVASATQVLERLHAQLGKSDNVAGLRDRVDGAIVQAANAERMFTEVRQRHEIRARDLTTAKAELAGLEKRLASLVNSVGGEGEILAQLTEESITDARDSLADVERALRKTSTGDALRHAVGVATDRVDRVDAAIRSQRQRITSAEKSREDELARLELAERRFSEFQAGIGIPALKDKLAVKEVIGTTEAAIRSASDRLRRPLTYAWLHNDEIKQERAAVNEAIAKVERAEAVVLDEKRRYETFLRDARANQANLDFAEAKLQELKAIVEEAKLGRIPTVQTALEDCECAYDFAVKQLNGDSEDAEQGRRAVTLLVDKLKKTEHIVITSKAQKEAEEKEKADIQDRLDGVLCKLQGVVAMIEAAGPTVKRLSEAHLADATTAINHATKLLRRGDNLKELGAAVRLASEKVDVVESEASGLKDRVEQAAKLKSAASKKLHSLAETLALSQDKAESNGVKAVQAVESALRQAEDALALAKRRADGDLEVWMREGTVISRLVDEAAFKVEAAEEVADEEVQRKDKADREREEVELSLEILSERHAMVVRESKEAGVAHLDAMQRAVELAEAEFAAVQAALPSNVRVPITNLVRLVTAEEEVFVAESRRLEARSAEVQKAAGDLTLLMEKMVRMEVLLETCGSTLPASTEQAFRAAQKAVREVERFATEGMTSLSLAVPRSDAVFALVRKAEDLLKKHLHHLQGLEEKRHDAQQRLLYLDRKFADLEEDVADFCSKSDHLRVQLEADWGNNCWWGSQTSHTQMDGTPIGRGEMKPISSVQIISESVAVAEAAMILVKKRVEGDLTAWVELGSAAIYRSLDDALAKVDRAVEVLEQEKVRVQREDQERQNAMRTLDGHCDRLAKLKVMAETKRVSGEPAVVESVRAAEAALEIVAKLLEAGNAHSSPPAMEVAAKKVAEAEEFVFVELQRKDRYNAQLSAAKEELARLRVRAQAVHELAELLQHTSVEAVSDSLRAMDKAVDRAGIAITSELAIAMINKEVRTVLQKIEHAEREVRREKIRREEIAKLRHRQEEDTRFRALKEAEAERRRQEQERFQRIQVENELEKLAYRLSVHRPALEKLQSNMTLAEDALRSARSRLADGGIVAAQAAAQSAVALTNSMETTAQSVWGGRGAYPEGEHVNNFPSSRGGWSRSEDGGRRL